jgi:diguanylate cyclase (GGDEF)-like protein/PAS domain S-box-containing protein
MYRVLTCLTTEHDWRLVLLACAICFLASVVVISLFYRAQATRGHVRFTWLGLGSVTAGCGIWATHFIGMLAFDPGIGVGYDEVLTGLSLVIAIVVSAIGLSVALCGSFRWSAALGGAIAGAGIAAMHYTGMAALELPGQVIFAPGLVIASVIFGVLLTAAAFSVAKGRDDISSALLAAILLMLAVVSLHFTGIGAAEIIPDPTRMVGTVLLSPQSLAYIIAGITATILGMSLVAALADRQSAGKVRRQKLLLDAALHNMSQGLCMFDADGRIILFNAGFPGMLGLSAEALTGHSLLDIYKSRQALGYFAGDPEASFASVTASARAGRSGTRITQGPNGRVMRVVEQPKADGGWVATVEDITEISKAEAQILYMARHDPLTDLPNRRLFLEQMEQSLRRVKRGEQLAVFCLDLDHFKFVNDSLGHPTGDQLLMAVARRLKECVRECDTIARLGGDEFAIVQVGTRNQPIEATILANRIVDVLRAPYDLDGHQVVIGASVGISVAPSDSSDPDQLMRNADMALYRAKADGRGAYRFFEAEMDARSQARRSLELDLRSALMNGEFELYFQSIHDGRDEIIGFETSVRWHHPIRGTVPPTSFLQLAEETGVVVPLGEWVLRKACAEAASWSRDVGVAVNVSPVQFRSPNLVPAVAAALSASGLRPGRLDIEITESALLQDKESTLTTLHALRNLGVKISIDEFGTGYSSLSYLRSFPFDKIKIDGSFAQDLGADDNSKAIVRAVGGLGKSLGIATNARGVETPEQLSWLRAEGCSEVQGTFFGLPTPAAGIETLLSKRARRRVVA